MDYRCPVCQKNVGVDLQSFVDHTEGHIVDIIKKDHPDWVRKDGVCKKCLEYYHKQMKGQG